ncbi:thiol-disulfide oxidoreductase DCC family protein [Thalassotalea sp. PP2-459]|uniref:thiol-disulfide oxidoreductase DCC family protein n=1 Tax=Thalassotalea sp. PP2-459 TaxID=1742724 RepID=UPI0009424905|nr:DUF393 domain-containing protein [Thalassotalea sp. PP2-459]OKY27861.1 hypothetical protein BI291_07355 [Thalassotalea sp. PP2-459]
MKNNVLTIFYDGYCPLCCAEMNQLKQCDKNNVIELVNLRHDNFSLNYPHINTKVALRVLHGEYQGKVLQALDVTYQAWRMVGKGIYVAPLKFPAIKQIANVSYLVIAKYRQPISSFLHRYLGIGKAHCENGTCYPTSRINCWRE